MGLGPALGQIPWQEKLRRLTNRRRGARLGEATVVSRHVHTGQPDTPHIITILSYLDAGQVMYQRNRQGEVIHIDIFHAVAEVDHRRVAAAIRHALEGIEPVGEEGKGRLLADYFDLCTGTGGGRVTGTLQYGNERVRTAHINHVHIAGRLHDDQLEVLLPLVSAVEAEIEAQGVEIRRIEKLHHIMKQGARNDLDLSNYSDSFDSLNKEQNPRGEGGSGGGSTGTEGQSLRASRSAPSGGQGADPASGSTGGPGSPATEAGASSGAGAAGAPRAGLAGGQGGSGGAEGGPDSYQPQSAWEALEEERRLQAALELSRKLGSPDEVKRVLDELSREQGWASVYGSGSSQAPFVVQQLEENGLVKRDIRGLRLTEAGKQLAAYLDKHLRDVKLRFRKLIRRMPSSGAKTRKPGFSKAPPSPDVRYGPIRGTAPAEEGAWLGDVAVPDTIRSALKRTWLERLPTGHGGTQPRLRLERRDIHVHLRSAEQPLHICLLIDASASMAGRRILAAKHLARHLLASTRDRVAVIAFQERDVRVYVPFTRDYSQVEDGLSRIQPMGLTPLAHGLTQSLDLIRESLVRRPLLLLITDGIPTVPKWSIDPLADALEAARQVGRGKIPFGCIGLQPSRRYLEELARQAGGTLHVVEELDEEALVTIAHRERIKTAQRSK